MEEVLKVFGIHDAELQIITGGLINTTWKVITPGRTCILQKVNDAVFQNPENIAHNISRISVFLKKHFPAYLFISPIPSDSGKEIIFFKGKGWFRLFPFLENSYTIQTVTKPEEAFEAAHQFGKFTSNLSGFDPEQLKITIPHFHDLALRYEQFLQAIQKGNRERIEQSKSIIRKLLEKDSIVTEYKAIKRDPAFKRRVTHHDTKISNVLFSKAGKAGCIIDLDTVMPGYFISDVGDMIRTYVTPVSEEEEHVEKIIIRKDFYRAIEEGYCSAMKDSLSVKEKQYFFYGGKCMVYMQALRFITDYLNNDAYYGARYTEHNYIRACNQVTLLELLVHNEKELSG